MSNSYPSYKPINVDWLAKLPDHWGLSRLGLSAWVRARLGWKGLKAEEYVDDGYIFLATPNIKGREIDFENVNYIDQARYEESIEIALHEGDVLLAKDGSTLGTVNVVRHLPRPATVNSSIAVITPAPGLQGIYLYYLFQSSYLDATIQRMKGGMGVPHLFQADLNKFYIPIPPLPEQAAIATFLDRETAKIDALIEEQKRLIELLKEKRQAVISHAVTKGLNPDAKMKPSGIEWLGDVPVHWELTSLKRLGSIRYGIGEPPIYREAGTPLIRATNVHEGRIYIEGLVFVDAADIPESRIAWLTPGDIIVVRSGAYTGDSAIVPNGLGKAIAGFDMVFRATAASPEFIQFTLLSTYVKAAQIDELRMRAAQPHLNAEELGGCIILLPPPSEQEELVRHLVAATIKFDSLIQEAELVITLLQERRSALISAAVTGKIDVRDHQIEGEAA